MSDIDPTDEIAAADVRNGEPGTIREEGTPEAPDGDADGGLDRNPGESQMPSDTDVQAERQP